LPIVGKDRSKPPVFVKKADQKVGGDLVGRFSGDPHWPDLGDP